MPHPSLEDFQQWQDNPVTRWVCAALREAAEENKAAWVEQSWGHGQINEIELTELRTRSDAYMAMADTEYDDWLKFNYGDTDE